MIFNHSRPVEVRKWYWRGERYGWGHFSLPQMAVLVAFWVPFRGVSVALLSPSPPKTDSGLEVVNAVDIYSSIHAVEVDKLY